MELTQLIQRAQQALDRGQYHAVDAACRHALGTYPTCLSAHRLLGESGLEQGRVEEAVERFELALVLDPLDVVASLGLGVAAEERGDRTAAYAHYLRAWELNPTLDQLRDELVRLRQALHGDGRLRHGRAGLASLFARTGQLHRAVAEWRAVAAADPDSIQARMALAEVLWRQGEDAAALALCREILAGAPETTRALAILADLQQRRGLPDAATTAATYRSLDPSGEIVTSLLAVKPQANLGWIVPEPAMVPPFDFDAAVVPMAPMPGPMAAATPAVEPVPAADQAGPSAPTPDVWDSLVRDIGGDGADPAGAGPDDIAPFSWPAGDADAAASWPVEAADFGFEEDLADAVPFDVAAIAGEPAGEPFADVPTSPVAPSLPEPVDADPLAALMPAAPAAPPPSDGYADQFITADGRVDLTVGWDDLDRTLAAATPSDEVAGFDDLIAQVGAEGIAPFNPLGDDASEEWEPFSEDDFGDWEEAAGQPATADTPATEIPVVEPPTVEAEPAVADDWAPPAAAPAPGYDSTDDLIWPDDLIARVPTAAPAATEPAAAPAAPAPAVPSPPVELDAVQAVTAGWDTIEDELAAAVPPSAAPVGDGLETFDDEGIVPFDFGAQPESVDPLANPDAVGAPLDFDDLLLVTSQDGTGPLGGGDAPAEEAADADGSDHDPGASAGEALALDPGSSALPDDWQPSDQPAAQAPDVLDGIQPFAFDDLAPSATDGPVDFSDVEDVAPAVVGEIDDFPFFEEPATDAGVVAAELAGESVDGWVADLAALDRAEEDPTGDAESDAGAWPAEADWPTEEAIASEAGVDAPIVVEPAPAAAAAEVQAGVADDTAWNEAPAAIDGRVPGPDASQPSPWPPFVSGTSELADRYDEVGMLFARLREEKSSLVGLGMLRVDRALTRASGPGPLPALVPEAAAAHASNGHASVPGWAGGNGHAAEPGTAEPVGLEALPPVRVTGNGGTAERERPRPAVVAPETGAEIARWRERLRLGAPEAEEVVAEAEARIAAAGPEPALLRVLGEAYLKLGRSDLAAAQFRAATARRARRP